MEYNPDLINQLTLLGKTFFHPYNIITSVAIGSLTYIGIFSYYSNSKKRVEQGKELKGLAKVLFEDELKCNKN